MFTMKLQRIKFYASILKNGIDTLDIHIVSHCNLSCKYCNAFSPLADPWYLDVNKFQKDFERFSILFEESFINKIHILGGEPLLHPQIIDILKIVRHCMPNVKISIITNGILLNKMPKEFFEFVKSKNIILAVSVYPSIKEKDIEGIERQMRPEMFKIGLDLYGTQDRYETFKLCPACNTIVPHSGGMVMGHSIEFYEGKLYLPCIDPKIRYIIKYLKTDNLPKDHGVSVYDYDNGRDLLFELFSRVPDACRFCKSITYGLPWELGTKSIEDYV